MNVGVPVLAFSLSKPTIETLTTFGPCDLIPDPHAFLCATYAPKSPRLANYPIMNTAPYSYQNMCSRKEG